MKTKKLERIQLGWVALLALALVAGGACKGHVEKDANGEVKSVGVETDPEAVDKVKEAGEEGVAALEEGAEEAGRAVEKGAKAVQMTAGDAAIAAKVKAKLLADPEVKGLDIEVQAAGGNVILKGRAETREQKQEAGKLARATEGVHAVRNRIRVAGGG
jgi:osmotically-inducible protein OsmY